MLKAVENKTNQELFERMPVPKALAQMCIPTIIGQMIVLVYNLADTFFIGRTGNPYMVAAASLVLPIFNISNAVSGLIGIGAGSLISRLLGAGKTKDASKISAFAFYFGIAVSLSYSLIVFFGRDAILWALGASDQTFSYAAQYALCVVMIGGIPTILQLTLSQLVRAVGCSREAAFGTSLGGLLNIGLDPLFMFVLLPKGSEILGAGIATLLSNIISMIYFIVLILRLRKKTVLSLSPAAGLPGGNLIRVMILGGIPAGASNLLFDFSQILINKLMAAYGDIALAAVGIVLKAERIPLNTGVGICQGMMPLVAYNYSAGNHKRMRKILNESRIAGLLVAAAAIIFYEVFAPQILRLFINNEATAVLGASFLRARCLATPFMFMCFHILYFFQAMGKAGYAFILALIRQLVLYAPLLLLMDYLLGMSGLVWTQLVSDGIMTLVSFWIYFRFDRNNLRGKSK